jgi:hypothetical protein
MLVHHTHGPLPHLRRKLLRPLLFRHRSTLSRAGASGKPGAVQYCILLGITPGSARGVIDADDSRP